MPRFTYIAVDEGGARKEGDITAPDVAAAAQALRLLGLETLQVAVAEEAPAAVGVSAAPAATPAGPIDLTRVFSSHELRESEDDEELEDATRRLEPWERGGPPQAAPPQPQVTQAVPAVERPAPSAGPAPGGYAPRLEVPSERESEDDLLRRFRERVIYPAVSGGAAYHLAPYYRQFAAMIGAGLTMAQTLSALADNTREPRLKQLTYEGRRRVEQGGRFSDVMRAHTWIFPEMHSEMVRAAEQGGMLDRVFLDLADYTEHELAMRRLIRAETFYPKLVLFCALMMLGAHFFDTGMPAISRLVLSGMGKDSYTLGQYLEETVGFGLLLLAVWAACMVVFRLFFVNSQEFRARYDAIKSGIPITGGIVKMFAMAKFMRTYASLYRAGFPMASTLRIAGDSAGNAILRGAAYAAAPQVERGARVSEALAHTGFLTPTAISMFQTGENSGSMDEILNHISDFYEAEARVKVRQVALVFSVFVLLLVGILVGMAVIRFYTGYAGAATGGGA